MNLILSSDIQQFISDQVWSGRFPTAEAVVEAAVTKMRGQDLDLDEETVAALNEAEDQADRGEGIDLDCYRAQIANRLPR